MIFAGVIIGGVSLLAGATLIKRRPGKLSLAMKHRREPRSAQAVEELEWLASPPSEEQESIEQDLKISGVSLALLGAGRVVPILMIPGVAGLAYLSYSALRRAYQDIRKKRRFTSLGLEGIVLPSSVIAGQFLIGWGGFRVPLFCAAHGGKGQGQDGPGSLQGLRHLRKPVGVGAS